MASGWRSASTETPAKEAAWWCPMSPSTASRSAFAALSLPRPVIGTGCDCWALQACAHRTRLDPEPLGGQRFQAGSLAELPQGLTISTPHPSKSATLRVARSAPRDRAIAAI